LRKKKKILGFTVLFAVLALSFTLTACAPDTEERYVTFVNETSLVITVTCKGLAPVILQKGTPGDPKRDTVKKTGSDIVLETIDFGNTTVQQAYMAGDGSIENYVFITGQVTGGKPAKNGLTLGSGTLTFGRNLITGGNPAL